MSLPYLPGWGDTLASALPQIGNNIAHVINPHIDQQKAFQESIAKNPELLQLIANNPGLAQSLQNSGFSKDIVQQTAGMQVDPTVAANRRIAISNAGVAEGTAQPTIQTAQNQARSTGAEATVAEGTVKPRIKSAETQSAFEDLKYTSAKTDFDKHAATLAKFPNPNIKAIGDSILNGTGVDAQQISALDEAGQTALKEYVDSGNKARERIKDMSVAQLVHHSGNQQERQFNIQMLKGLSVDLRGQLTNATQLISKIKPDLYTKILSQKEPTDPAARQQWQDAKTAMDQYQQALAIVAPGSELNKQLKLVDAKYGVLLGLEGSNYNPNPTSTSSANPDHSAAIAQAKTMYASGQATAQDVQQLVLNGTITAQEAAQILGSKGKKSSSDVNLNDTLSRISTLPEAPKPKPRVIPGVVSDRK